MAKITIATPMYGGVCHGVFLKSLISLLGKLKTAGHEANFIDISNESLITRARNVLTEIFLRSHSEYLLFIDADQGFNADGVIQMINEKVDLVGAPVPMKAINWDRVKKAAKSDAVDISKHTAIFNVNMNAEQKDRLRESPNSIVEVDYVGTGMMLISRNVFETTKSMVQQYRCDQQNIGGIIFGDPIYDFWQARINSESDRMLSEDYFFCDLWKKAGGKVYLAPYVKVTHAGTYWFS